MSFVPMQCGVVTPTLHAGCMGLFRYCHLFFHNTIFFGITQVDIVPKYLLLFAAKCAIFVNKYKYLQQTNKGDINGKCKHKHSIHKTNKIQQDQHWQQSQERPLRHRATGSSILF